MFTSSKLIHFISLLREAATVADLSDVLAEFTEWLGFERFAMGHHVDLARPPVNAIRATNYDEDWIAQVVELRYFVDDPIHATSTRADMGFRWDSIDPRHLTDRQQTILGEARRHGLCVGYTIPVTMPGEYSGSCSFAARSYEKLRPHALELSDIVASAAFHGARNIMRKQDGRTATPVPVLRPKERDALILVGRGKTDHEIGEIMGISRWTAHDHVEAVRRVYGNIPRTSLVLRAVFDNQFSFADAFRR